MNNAQKEELQQEVEELGYGIDRVGALARAIMLIIEFDDNMIMKSHDTEVLAQILNRYIDEIFTKQDYLEKKVLKI